MKFAAYVDRDVQARVRAAYRNLPGDVRPRSLSDLVEQMLETQVSELERRYNEGRPWAAVQPGEIPPGPQPR